MISALVRGADRLRRQRIVAQPYSVARNSEGIGDRCPYGRQARFSDPADRGTGRTQHAHLECFRMIARRGLRKLVSPCSGESLHAPVRNGCRLSFFCLK
jgi:hypothetical protein